MSSVRDSFEVDLVPSIKWLSDVNVSFVADLSDLPCTTSRECSTIFLVHAEGQLPGALGWDREALESAGFEAKPGSMLAVPAADGSSTAVVGLGKHEDADADIYREAGAAGARAVATRTGACLVLPGGTTPDLAAAVAEGALLARYQYATFKKQEDSASKRIPLQELTIVGTEVKNDAVEGYRVAVASAKAYARATVVARDLTNAPPGHLTAREFEAIAQQLGAEFGFGVEILELAELDKLGCGGIVGVNRGSEVPARLIKLAYTPAGSVSDGSALVSKRLALVGKGITFDSGGLSLKPADSMIEMKMDMGGAAAILGAFTGLADAGVALPIDAWTPITDNMVSGNSMRVGEVIMARNDKSVEVKNTDAEGRLVLMDGLALAAETDPTWIVDIATLTGAQMVALGKDVAAVMGTDQALVDQLENAAAETGEQIWELPLVKRYMKLLDSDIADLSNVGGRLAGSITAGLFLSNFVGEIPWAHIDIAGPMSSDKDDRWLTVGATGFGARLLLKLAGNLGHS